MTETVHVPHHGTQATNHRLCLVSMPFSSLQHPGLGLALIAQLARDQGVDTIEKHFSFDFADAIGLSRYALLSDGRYYQALLGEWVFSDLIYPRGDTAAMDYLSTVVAEHASGVEWLTVVHDAIAARKEVETFVENCADEILQENPTVVGITSSFQQVMSSVAITRALRKRSPELVIVMGGANCEGPLGQALLQEHPELDAVCIGEGDHAFPDFLHALETRRDLPEIPGILTQSRKTRPLKEVAAALTTDLDALPIPDFSSFFDKFHATPGLSEMLKPSATLETSRGCWWGAKHHCTFCGLNGQSMTYRSKSADRAYAEFGELADLYGPDLVVVDNILDHRYLKTLIPRLAQDDRKFLMHYEVKSNLSPAVIATLAQGGVRKIQPGIETFDTKTLVHMRKGVSGIQNIQTLKLCAEAGVFVEWCFLHGFPGENNAAFERMAELIPQLHHLQPPGSIGPVRADRFSPYFEHPDAFGIEVQPAKPYSHIFDVPKDELPKFSYHFDIIKAAETPDTVCAEPTLHALKVWQEKMTAAELYFEGETIVDKRSPDQPLVHQLGKADLRTLELSATIVGSVQLQETVAPEFGAEEARVALRRMLDLGLLHAEDGSILSLVLRTPGYRRAPGWDTIRSNPEQAFSVQMPNIFAG